MKKLLLTFLIAFITALGANAKTVTKSITSFSSTSGNIDDNISYAAAKGGGTTQVAVYSNEIRIYKPASGKKLGGEITISAVNECKINSVTISAGKNTAKVNIYLDGSSTATKSDLTFSNKKVSIDGISASSVRFVDVGTDRIDIASIEVTYTTAGGDTPDPKVLGEIMMGSTPVSTEEAYPTTAIVKGGGTISFTSENAASMNVYTLSDNGLAASSGEGSVTWTAPAATDEEQVINLRVVSQLQNEGEELQKKEAFVTVTVPVKSNVSDDFTLITDAGDLYDGMEMYIVSGKKALSTTQNTSNRGETDVTITNGILTPTSSAQLITLEATNVTDKPWKFNVGDGYLYAASSSSNHLKTLASPSNNNEKATISIETNGNATITFQGTSSRNVLKYNDSSKLFSCYTSGQTAVQIYGRKSLSPVEPGAVTSNPTAVNDVITVDYGLPVSFSSAKAAKLKVEFESATDKNTTVTGDTYTYTADAEDIITITPIDIAGTEYAAKAGMFSIEFTAPEAVVATPAASEDNTITVNKGENITFTSAKAAKLKVQFMEGDPIETVGNTYTYKADAEDILTITPIGYNGKEATDKMAVLTVVFPTPEAIVVTPAPENGTIFIQKGETITVTSANADHLNYEIDSESGATAAGVNSWTYTADKDVTIMVTPVGQNGVIYDGKNETGHSNTDLSVIFSVDVDLSLGEITFSPAAGAVYANTEVEISCRNAESLSYTITVGETTSESVSVTGNTAKVNIAEACTVNVTANGENETSKTASAAYTIKESAGITHTLSAAKDQVTFTCEGADKIKVVTYEIDGSSTEETTTGSSATVNCSSMYAVFDVEGLNVEDESETSIGEASFNLLSELNATITNKGEAWYRVNSISELQENVDYIIVSHFPQANAKYEDIYMTNKYTLNGGQGKFDYGKLLNGELVDNDAYMTLDAASALTDAAIFRLISDGNGKWAFKITNVTGDATGEKILTYPTTEENSIRLIEVNEATNKDYTTVYAGPGTADYPARMGAMRFDFEDSGSDYKYLRFNAGADGQGNPQGAMFRIYSNVAGIDHVRPLYLYAKLQQAPAEVPDYTAIVMYNDMTSTQEMGKLSVEGEEMDLMCHYDKLNGHNGGKISVKIIGFDGQAKILYPKERTAQSAYNKVKPNTASGSLTMAAATHYDLAVDGSTTTVPADLKDHYYEIEVQPFNWTDIAAFNIPTAIEDIDVENGEAIEEEGDARYFNLQGLEVKNPGEGIYIRVANGKATKILKK